MTKGEELLKQADGKWNLVKECPLSQAKQVEVIRMVEAKYQKAWKKLNKEVRLWN